MIPLIRPMLPPLTRVSSYFAASIDAGQYSNFGPCHDRLVDELGLVTGGPTLPVSTGTAAIEIALLALGIPKGARVLVPDFTHTGTVLAVKRAGMEPVLAGVHGKSWCLRIDETSDAWVRGEIDAAIVVNPFGYGVDMQGWESMAEKTKLPLVYDFAAAWGYFPKARNPVCYSFHATKNMGIGEGGAVVFPDAQGFAIGKRLVNFDTILTRDIGSLDGSNQKMDELRCAAALAALEPGFQAAINDRIVRKRRTLETYRSFLKSVEAPFSRFSKPSLCVLSGLPARDLEAASLDLGIVFRRYYPLLSRMPALKDLPRLSESGPFMESCCALPSDVDLQEAYEVVNVIKKFIGGSK